MYQSTKEAFFNALRAVQLFCCQDETRFHLNGIYVEIDTLGILRFVATDGHILAISTVVGTAQGASEKDGFLTSEQVKQLLTMIKPTNKADRSTPVGLQLSANRRSIRCTVDEDQQEFTDSGEEFPPWRQVMPEAASPDSKGTAKIGLSLRYLERAGKAVTFMCGGKVAAESAVFAISIGDTQLDSVRLDFSAPDIGDLTIVIMPCRI